MKILKTSNKNTVLSWGENDKVVGTRQGYIVSSNICRDSSCFSIKEVEKKELGIMFNNLIKNNTEQQVSTAFIDEIDFATDRENAQIKMQQIIETYTSLY